MLERHGSGGQRLCCDRRYLVLGLQTGKMGGVVVRVGCIAKLAGVFCFLVVMLPGVVGVIPTGVTDSTPFEVICIG